MRFILSILLASTAALAQDAPVFNGCGYAVLDEPYYNCGDVSACNVLGIDCYTACRRAGTDDGPDSFLMATEANSRNPDRCGCRCVLVRDTIP